MPTVSSPAFTSVSCDFAHDAAAVFVVDGVCEVPPPHPAVAVAAAASATRHSRRCALDPIRAASLSAVAGKAGTLLLPSWTRAAVRSGTTTDGIWSLQCTVPAIVASGSYIVTPYVEDILGQWVNTNGGPPSDTQGLFTIS